MLKIKILPLMLIFLFVGCMPYESLINFQEGEGNPLLKKSISNYKPITFEPGDILTIEVSSLEAEAVEIFKDYQTSGFLISEDGTIDFPLVGKVKLEGQTVEQAKQTLMEGLDRYFDIPPTVNVHLSNFTVTVNGEVSSPGIVPVTNNRINIIEAITKVGDFTSYSKRDSVMVIREQKGERTFGYLNFNSSEIFESPYFYLKQNDVIYVQPEKRIWGNIRTQQDKLLPYVSVAVSIILLTVTISRNR
jgi:polysaccharide export outer membrane protein